MSRWPSRFPGPATARLSGRYIASRTVRLRREWRRVVALDQHRYPVRLAAFPALVLESATDGPGSHSGLLFKFKYRHARVSLDRLVSMSPSGLSLVCHWSDEVAILVDHGLHPTTMPSEIPAFGSPQFGKALAARSLVV